MYSQIRTALTATLMPHFGLSKSRLETLVVFLIALIQGRTVNLTHVASHFHGQACYASKYRRLQRFFQYVRLDQAIIARVVVRMLNLSRPKCLALDRTNWKVGKKDINVLMLAIVTRRFRVPILWTVLSHPGNSNSAQRIALLQQYLEIFDASSIDLLLADREFIGAEWINFLIKNDIQFAIRAREDLRFVMNDGRLWSIRTLLRNKRARKTVQIFNASLPDDGMALCFAAKQIKSGEWLVIMTNAAIAVCVQVGSPN